MKFIIIVMPHAYSNRIKEHFPDYPDLEIVNCLCGNIRYEIYSDKTCTKNIGRVCYTNPYTYEKPDSAFSGKHLNNNYQILYN